MEKKPNILIIMSDQFRGDCMGFMGHPDVKTPYLDTLAARGVAFTNAYSACPSCVPARAGFLTGYKPSHHRRVGYVDGEKWEFDRTIASECAKNGYYTKACGKMHIHPTRTLAGFNHIDLHDGYLHYVRYQSNEYRYQQRINDDYFYYLRNEKGIDADTIDTGLECNSWVARPWCYDEQLHPTNWVTNKAMDFLRTRDPGKPFLLFASYLKPHPPLDPPEYYYNMYMNMDLRDPAIGDWEKEDEINKLGRVFDSKTGPKDKFMIKQMMAGYYGLITHLDHQIGKLIQALVEHEVYDNTIIMFTADHGEELGDHHLFRKSRAYEGSCHIPFIISAPEHLVKGIKRGAKAEGVVELMDIMPTVLDLIGAEKAEGVDGKSLVEMLSDPDKKVRDYLHCEHAYMEHSSQWIVTEKDKYIWNTNDGKEEYFDLEKDPRELHEASKENKERVAKMRQALIKELEGRPEGFVKEGGLVAGRPYEPLLDKPF